MSFANVIIIIPYTSKSNVGETKASQNCRPAADPKPAAEGHAETEHYHGSGKLYL